MWISGPAFLIAFIILTCWFIWVAIKNLTNPSLTDYHKIGNLFRR